MFQAIDQAAIAAPAPVRSSLGFDRFIRPTRDVLDFPGRYPVAPFPAWDPAGDPGRDFADRLAWHNDSPDNDWLDGYPGPGWDDPDVAGPEYEPTPADLAAYDCAALDEHRGCGCRFDAAHHEAYEADRWFNEEFGADWHDAESHRLGRGPLNPVVGGHHA